MRFAFLVYVSRSGSTLLARQLASASREVLVLPEFGLLDFLLAEGEPAVRRQTTEGLLRLFSLDRQLPALGLDAAGLRRVAERAAGQGIRGVMEALADACAEVRGSDPSVVVVKRGSLIRHAAAIGELFPDGTYIHIVRDGRAVANSRLSSPKPYAPGLMMGRGDPWHMGRSWTKFVRRLRRMKRHMPVPLLEVRYEALCRAPEVEIGRLCDGLGVVVFGSRGEQRQEFDIAERERIIHARVHQPPALERLDGWRTELPHWQGVAIEALQHAELRAWGYPAHFTATPVFRGLCLARAQVTHWWRTVQYYSWRFSYYRANRGLLRNRLRRYLLPGSSCATASEGAPVELRSSSTA